MINFIRGFLFLSRSIYGKPVTAGSVNLTGIEKYTKNCKFFNLSSFIFGKYILKYNTGIRFYG